MDTLRICAWSGPRNVSTALMYSFARRPDTRALDEPLYGHYLKTTGASHPGSLEIIASMDSDGERVVAETILGPCDRPILFMKQMTHHLVSLDHAFLRHTVNILLIREPREVLLSLSRVLDASPTASDTGLRQQATLFGELEALGQRPPILDSRELLEDPRGVLAELCERVGIPFDECMLSWPSGPHPEDGVWAKHWYASVHKTTGFEPYAPRSEALPDGLEEVLEECQEHYRFLRSRAIEARARA
jgi:hypothetical protein